MDPSLFPDFKRHERPSVDTPLFPKVAMGSGYIVYMLFTTVIPRLCMMGYGLDVLGALLYLCRETYLNDKVGRDHPNYFDVPRAILPANLGMGKIKLGPYNRAEPDSTFVSLRNVLSTYTSLSRVDNHYRPGKEPPVLEARGASLSAFRFYVKTRMISLQNIMWVRKYHGGMSVPKERSVLPHVLKQDMYPDIQWIRAVNTSVIDLAWKEGLEKEAAFNTLFINVVEAARGKLRVLEESFRYRDMTIVPFKTDQISVLTRQTSYAFDICCGITSEMCWRSWRGILPGSEAVGCAVDIFSIIAIASFRRRVLITDDKRKYALEHWILLETEVKNWSERYKHLGNVFEYPIRLFPTDISPLHWMIRTGEWELATRFINCPFFPRDYRVNIPYKFVPWCNAITPMTLARLIRHRTNVWPAIDKIERVLKITEIMWSLYYNGAIDSILPGEAYRKQRDDWDNSLFFEVTEYKQGDFRSPEGGIWRAHPFYGETPQDLDWFAENNLYRKNNMKDFERLIYHGDALDPFLQDDSAIQTIMF